MYLTTVKLVLRNSFDLNYLRKMCGMWVSRAFGVPWISDFSGRYFPLDPLTSVDQDQREMARSPRSITPTPSLLNDAMPTSDAIPTSESASTPGKNCYSRGICGHSCHRGRDLLFGLSVQLSICSGRKGLGLISPHGGTDRRRRIRFRQSHEIILQRIKAGGTSRSPF